MKRVLTLLAVIFPLIMGTAQADQATILDNNKVLAPELPTINHGFQNGMNMAVQIEPYTLPYGDLIREQTIEIYAGTNGGGIIEAKITDPMGQSNSAKVTVNGGPIWVAGSSNVLNSGNYYEEARWECCFNKRRIDPPKKNCMGPNEGGAELPSEYNYYCRTWQGWVEAQWIEINAIKFPNIEYSKWQMRIYAVAIIDKIETSTKESMYIVRWPSTFICGSFQVF